MLLTIATTHQPAADLGYLLHKHPDRCQCFELSFGKARVFYPEVGALGCSACLLLDVDPVGMVRGKSASFALAQYVSDRPYTASSLMSVAIAQVFGSALQGRCKDRPELAKMPIPLSARIDVLPVRGGEVFLRGVFEPLRYRVEATRCPLDEHFPEWGESPYFAVTIHKTTTLAELLTHLYVLIPVFDNAKHYWIGDDEMEKLLAKGEGWLAEHPKKEEITRRYLKFQPSLYREALARLLSDEELQEVQIDTPADESLLETSLSLNDQRLGCVMAALRASGAKRVLDLGCGEGKLIRELLKEKQFEQIVGLDVSIRALEMGQRRLNLERLPSVSPLLSGEGPGVRGPRVRLIHGSLIYRDKRLQGFDAAAIVEVVEHLDPPRLSAFERVVFEFAKPRTVVLTTPNRESPCETTNVAGLLEHPAEAFAYYRGQGAPRVVCEEKHMGSRAVVIVCRDEQAAKERFGIAENEIGIVYMRTGRRFFSEADLERQFLERLRATLTNADFWDAFNTTWACFDCELMPWSAKAQELLRGQYAAVGAAGRASLPRAVAALEQAALRLGGSEKDTLDQVKNEYAHRADNVARFVTAYRHYCWPVSSLTDLKLAPFHLLATEGHVHMDKTHVWHMETLAKVCREDGRLLLETPHKMVDVTLPASEAEGIDWWTKLTEAGGEGMVVKPLDFILRGKRGLAQPAVKCRGREYLRIIYGPDYTAGANLPRLRARGLGAKRALALGEFALGIEALERFVRREPLRRVHECVFGVLALESEPVDPRL